MRMAVDEQYRTEVLCHFSVSKQHERQFPSSMRDVSNDDAREEDKRTKK